MALARSERFINNELLGEANNSQAKSGDNYIVQSKIDAPAVNSGFGNYYALIIGVNEYEDPEIDDLDQPVSDASTLYSMLIQHYTFEPEKIIKLNQ